MWCGALVASIVVLTGCTPDEVAPTGGGSSSEAVTTSPTPTMGPAVALPDKPEAWEGTGELGAKAAAVWFLRDLYRYVLETNDTAEWERLSTADCEFCAGKVDMAAEYEADGREFRQDGDAQAAVTRVEVLNPLSYAVLVDFDQPAISEYARGGQWLEEYPGESSQILVILHREGPDWLLRAGEPFGVEEQVPLIGAAE